METMDKIYTNKVVQRPFSSEKERKYKYIVLTVGNRFPLISMVKSKTSFHTKSKIMYRDLLEVWH